jgi:hypothetical protein
VIFREGEKIFAAGLKPERIEFCLRHDNAKCKWTDTRGRSRIG